MVFATGFISGMGQKCRFYPEDIYLVWEQAGLEERELVNIGSRKAPCLQQMHCRTERITLVHGYWRQIPQLDGKPGSAWSPKNRITFLHQIMWKQEKNCSRKQSKYVYIFSMSIWIQFIFFVLKKLLKITPRMVTIKVKKIFLILWEHGSPYHNYNNNDKEEQYWNTILEQ